MSLKGGAAGPIIALVVAMGGNRAIGKGGDLPWRLSSDMRYFRKITMGKPVIMGRRTFKSLPRVLDGDEVFTSRSWSHHILDSQSINLVVSLISAIV